MLMVPLQKRKKVVCRLCKQVIGYSGNTTNLTYHLQRLHPTEHQQLTKEVENDEDKPGPSTTKTVQLTLSGAISRTTPFQQDSVRHNELVNATANFITQSLQPIRVVDEPSFRRLLQIAEPRFKLPHHTHFTDKVIPRKYHELRATVEKDLTAIEKCTFTTDLWTSQHQHRAYISLTVHYINAEFKLNSKCLQTFEISTDHSATSLEEVLSSLLCSWNISDKVCGATTDNASNMVNAIGLLGIQHFPCVAHTLQLSILRMVLMFQECEESLDGAGKLLNILINQQRKFTNCGKNKRCSNFPRSV